MPGMGVGVDCPRVRRIAGQDEALLGLIERLIELSCKSLPKMFREDAKRFAFTLVPDGDHLRLEGESLRYGGIVLLGARWLDEDGQRSILGGETALEFCERLVAEAGSCTNLGHVAVVAWAAAELEHPKAEEARQRMLQLEASGATTLTVENAWVLSALSAAQDKDAVAEAAQRVFANLMTAYTPGAGVFAHNFHGGKGGGIRAHVACFADQVYPIQALSRFHKAFGREEALAAANRCGEQICRVQGDAGQWWWHYDARTGLPLDGYPVYSVHQDSMAPMALLDLEEAGGDDHAQAIALGLRWMEHAPELGISLMDEEREIIWRKIGRTDPKKIARALRFSAARLHPSLRLGILDTLFPPTRVDWESRPYHPGWVLHTWLGHL